jgi:hypothetical protein
LAGFQAKDGASWLAGRDSGKYNDEEGGDWTKQERGEPPQESAPSLALCQTSIDEGESSPADEVLRVFLHSEPTFRKRRRFPSVFRPKANQI